MAKEIIGKKIVLTPITYDDTNDIVRWRNKDFVRECFIYRKLFTVEGHNTWMINMVNKGKCVQFIIWEQASKQKIGSVYLRNIDPENKKCEFGIFIGEEEKIDLGYGREAALLITEYAFRELKMNKVFLRVLADNVRAYRSYLHAGFEEEGIFRQDVWVDGQYLDIIFMAKIKQDL